MSGNVENVVTLVLNMNKEATLENGIFCLDIKLYKSGNFWFKLTNKITKEEIMGTLKKGKDIKKYIS